MMIATLRNILSPHPRIARALEEAITDETRALLVQPLRSPARNKEAARLAAEDYYAEDIARAFGMSAEERRIVPGDVLDSRRNANAKAIATLMHDAGIRL